MPGYPQLIGWVRECPLGPAVVSGPARDKRRIGAAAPRQGRSPGEGAPAE